MHNALKTGARFLRVRGNVVTESFWTCYLVLYFVPFFDLPLTYLSKFLFETTDLLNSYYWYYRNHQVKTIDFCDGSKLMFNNATKIINNDSHGLRSSDTGKKD